MRIVVEEAVAFIELAIEALENDEVDDFEEFIAEELNQFLDDEPYALIEIDCDQIEKWQTLAQHIPPQNVIDKLEELDENTISTFGDFEVQYLDDADGAVVNMDYFPVVIDVLPTNPNTNQQFSPNEFLDYIRKNINNFVDNQYSVFAPSTITGVNEATLWQTNNPIETIISIDIPSGHDGSVVCSAYNNTLDTSNDDHWIFTTLEVPWDFIAQGYDGPHPVSGNREFGFEFNEEDGSFTFFTRGVDRFESNFDYNIADYMESGAPFSGADNLWTSFQTKLQNFVNDNGGLGNSIPQSINRPNWSDVKDVLQGLRPISDLGCN
ncbi:hypothetical protein [Psychroserpens sp.]